MPGYCLLVGVVKTTLLLDLAKWKTQCIGVEHKVKNQRDQVFV